MKRRSNERRRKREMKEKRKDERYKKNGKEMGGTKDRQIITETQ